MTDSNGASNGASNGQPGPAVQALAAALAELLAAPGGGAALMQLIVDGHELKRQETLALFRKADWKSVREVVNRVVDWWRDAAEALPAGLVGEAAHELTPQHPAADVAGMLECLRAGELLPGDLDTLPMMQTPN